SRRPSTSPKLLPYTMLFRSEITKTDLIIIPAIDGDLRKGLEENKAFILWITHHYKAGAEVASLCVGAFLLAASGLVDGKKCATQDRKSTRLNSSHVKISYAV